MTRLYQLILGRKADAAGLESWLTVLLSGEKTASDIVLKFFKSEEWQSRATSDEEFGIRCRRCCSSSKGDGA